MEKFLQALFDLTKLPTKFFLLLSIVSGFVLFSNSELLSEKLHLAQINLEHGWIISIVFIATSGLVVVNFIIWIFNYFRRKILLAKLKKHFIKKLKTLDMHEQSVLREFVLRSQKSIEMPINDPVVSGLLNNNILVMNRQFGSTSIMRGMDASLSINETAEEYLELSDLGLSSRITDEEISWAKQRRPDWTNKGWY